MCHLWCRIYADASSVVKLTAGQYILIGGITIKVITNQTVFIQDYDMRFIMDNITWMPNGILDECFATSPDGIVVYSEDPGKSWRFIHKFTDKRNVRWFREQKWLVDWNEVSRLTPDKLARTIQDLDFDLRRELSIFRDKPQEYKDENHTDFFRKHEKTAHELTSLILAHQYLTGDIWFHLPPGAKPAANMTIWAKLRHLWANKAS